MADPVSAQWMAKQREVLAHLQEAIGSLGYETRLFDVDEAEGVLPGPLLLAGVERDAQGRDRTLQFGFLPLPANDDFDYLSLLQCYARLPFTAPLDRRSAIEKALVDVNQQTALGYFGATAEGSLFYRYVLATSKWSLLEVEMIQQLLLVCIHMQNHFSPVIEAVAQDES